MFAQNVTMTVFGWVIRVLRITVRHVTLKKMLGRLNGSATSTRSKMLYARWGKFWMTLLIILWRHFMTNMLIEKWLENDRELSGHSSSFDDDIVIEKAINALWPERIIEAKRWGNKQAAEYALREWRQKYLVMVFDENGTLASDNVFDTITESNVFINSIKPGYQYVRRIVS